MTSFPLLDIMQYPPSLSLAASVRDNLNVTKVGLKHTFFFGLSVQQQDYQQYLPKMIQSDFTKEKKLVNVQPSGRLIKRGHHASFLSLAFIPACQKHDVHPGQTEC